MAVVIYKHLKQAILVKYKTFKPHTNNRKLIVEKQQKHLNRLKLFYILFYRFYIFFKSINSGICNFNRGMLVIV